MRLLLTLPDNVAAMPEAASSPTKLLRRGVFARLWWAGLVSSTGDWVTIFASLAVADSIAGGTGTVTLIVSRILPGLFFGAVVGVIADRVDRKKILLLSDLGRAAVVPALMFVSDLPTLVLVNLVLEFLSLLGQSPRAAVIPRIVGPADIVTANSLSMGAAYGTIPVGAGLGFILAALPAITFGTLIPEANAELAPAFLFDSVTFLLSGVIVATLPKLPIDRSDLDNDRGRFRDSLTDLRTGVSFLWRNRAVRRVIIGMSTGLFGGGTVIVIGLPFVTEVLGADSRGFFAIVAALGLGAAIGVFLVSAYAPRDRRSAVFAGSLIATGVGLTAAALTDTVAGASGWLIVMGLGAGSSYVMGLTQLHEQVEDEMRGRVFAALFTLMRIGLFFSMMVAVPLRGFITALALGPPLDGPNRVVLFLGGNIIVLAGLGAAWSARASLTRPELSAQARDALGEASFASGSYPGSNRKRTTTVDAPADDSETEE